MKTYVIFFIISIISIIPEIKAQQEIKFPDLPYAYDALEVFTDKQTMEIHYSRHHKTYYNNFVKAVNDNNLGGLSPEEMFSKVSQLPVAIRNQGGGYYNHCLFWNVMSPAGGGKPDGKLLNAVNLSFQSFEKFVKSFENAANSQFGSGWAWLVVDNSGKLVVTSTANQDNPLMDVVSVRGIPILALDVWEHAYYLRYQNKRSEYVSNFWKVVDWKAVEKLYDQALQQLNK